MDINKDGFFYFPSPHLITEARCVHRYPLKGVCECECVSVCVCMMRNTEVDRYIQNLMACDSDCATATTDPSQGSKELKKRIQNRKAQKAFRLRKEAKMMELEQKLNESEMIQSLLYDEVNKLKDENIVINKVYRQLNKFHQKSPPSSNDSNLTLQPKYDVAFPTMDEFYNTLIDNDSEHRYNDGHVSALQYNDEEGNTLLTVPATWKYLLDLHDKNLLSRINNSGNNTAITSTSTNTSSTTVVDDNYDYDENEMDIDLIMASLHGHEVCHGHGPAYKKSLIDQVIKYHRRR